MKLRVTDLKSTEGEGQHRNSIFARKLEADVSWVRNKRQSLVCQSGHRTEVVKQIVDARLGKNGTAECAQEKFTSRKSRDTVSLERKFLVGRLGTVMLSMKRPRQHGNHTTEINTAEM